MRFFFLGVVYLIFFFSGAAALIYEGVWVSFLGMGFGGWVHRFCLQGEDA